MTMLATAAPILTAPAMGGALPLVDLTSPDFAKEVDDSFRGIGFVAVSGVESVRSSSGHSIMNLRDRVYGNWREFTRLSDGVKRKYHVDPTGQRGYTPDGAESTQLFTELRSHMMISRSLPHEHPLLTCRPLFYAPNVVIPEVPTLVPNTEELAEVLELLALRMFESLERYLELPFGSLASSLVRGEMLMRLHHYPKAEVVGSRILNGMHTVYGRDVDGVEVVDIRRDGKIIQNVLRAGPHSDTGHDTLLLGTEVAGLCVQKSDGSVLRFTTLPDTVGFQVADFLEPIVPGWHSSIHWVNMTPESAKTDRYSLADFVHQRPTAKAGSIVNGALLFSRLHEIGYIRGDDGQPSASERDRLISKVLALPKEEFFIPAILEWEERALRLSIITRPELSRYYRLTKPKTGKYEPLTAPEQA